MIYALIASLIAYGWNFYSGTRLGAAVPTETIDITSYSWGQLFLHNLSAVAALFAGCISFGISTLIGLFVQGLAHGAAVAATGLPLSQVLIGLFPHGLFEFPAIMAAAVFGFYPWLCLATRSPMVWRRLVGLGLFSILFLAVGAAFEVRR